MQVEPVRYGVIITAFGADNLPAIVDQNRAAIEAIDAERALIAHFPLLPSVRQKYSADVDFRKLWCWYLATHHDRGKLYTLPKALPKPLPVMHHILDANKDKYVPDLIPVRASGDTVAIPFNSTGWKMLPPPEMSKKAKGKGKSPHLDLGWYVNMDPDENGLGAGVCGSCAYRLAEEEFGYEATGCVCTAWPDGVIPAAFIYTMAKTGTWSMCWQRRMCPYYAVKEGKSCVSAYRRWELASR